MSGRGAAGPVSHSLAVVAKIGGERSRLAIL
jgi:hypothetical protein